MKLDRRRKYYIIFDCETATLPLVNEFSEARQSIAIAKPLIYDFGYTIIDRTGKIYARRNHLVSEIFSVPSIFNTAYYAVKRPIYLEKLKNGEIDIQCWNTIMEEFLEDLDAVEMVGAYNSMFDYKKAIPFTERYIQALYSPNYQEWEMAQRESCAHIAGGSKTESEEFDPMTFSVRDKEKPLFDVWGLACQHILNCDEYRAEAIRNNWISRSGKFYSTTAENCYRFINGDYEFEERHTAIDDCEIEAEIFAKVCDKVPPKDQELGIIYFPFRIVGKVNE